MLVRVTVMLVSHSALTVTAKYLDLNNSSAFFPPAGYGNRHMDPDPDKKQHFLLERALQEIKILLFVGLGIQN